MDQHREVEPLQRLADPVKLGAERVDVLVDRAELAADEAEVALHPLELVDRIVRRRVDGSEPDQPGGIASHVGGDVVVRDDETGCGGVEGQDDRSIDVCERTRVVVVQAPAQRDLGPGRTRLRRELLADVERVLADMGMDVGDHGVIIDHPGAEDGTTSVTQGATGFTHSSSVKRAKSVSADTTASPWSSASAASCASVTAEPASLYFTTSSPSRCA